MVHTRPEWFHFIDQIINWLSIKKNQVSAAGWKDEAKQFWCAWGRSQWATDKKSDATFQLLISWSVIDSDRLKQKLNLSCFFFFFVSSAFVLREIIEQEVWTVSSWASWLVVEYDWLSRSACSSIKMANDAVGLMAACLLWPLPSDICQTHFWGNGTHEMLWTNQEASFKSSILVKVNTCLRSLDKWWSTNP